MYKRTDLDLIKFGKTTQVDQRKADAYQKKAEQDNTLANLYGIKCKKCSITFWISLSDLGKKERCKVCRY